MQLKKRRKRKGKGISMSNDFYVGYYEDHYLAHHGILGQKWGIRRYQNPDGSLTDAGYKRYGKKHLDANMKQDIRKKKQMDMQSTATATGIAAIGGATLALATGGSLPLSLLASAGSTAAVNSIRHRISTAKLKSDYAKMVAERKKGEDEINGILKSKQERANFFEKDKKRDPAKYKDEPEFAMLTPDEAKKLGLDESTKVPDEEAAEFWKALAAEYEKKKK